MELLNAPERPNVAASELVNVTLTSTSKPSGIRRLPRPSLERLQTSRAETAFDTNDIDKLVLDASNHNDTVLYLAYGSNLSIEKFRQARGIHPLSQINVQVPSLRLTFDLPGIPYSEPCFANSGLRDPDQDRPDSDTIDEKSPFRQLPVQTRPDYHKNRWHKGLIGVVYEVTRKDYAHIIATEGGGTSYKDIVVDCYPFATDDLDTSVPQDPTTTPIKAHTLFAPARSPAKDPPPYATQGAFARPDPSYAQPSARYLKLITDGASELGLPLEYQKYLNDIRPYQKTTARQRIGSAIFLVVWAPLIILIFTFGRLFTSDQGKLPTWLGNLTGFIFRAAWISYDNFFCNVFGDGERTLTDRLSNFWMK